MGKVIAIDYGAKRIGFAISDINQRIALPLETVEGGKKEIENVVAFLLPRKKEIELILIGLPLLLNGKKGEMAEKVELFAAKLAQAIDLPIKLIDERLSSKHADQSLRELSLNRKQRGEKVDLVAAMHLLQGYLDLPK